MATKKTTKNNQKKKASAKRAPAKQKSNQIYEESLLYQCLPYLLIVLSVLLELCLIIPGQLGPLGGGISALFFGLFSVCAYVLPLLIIVVALFMRRFDGVLGSKGLLAFLCLTMICVLFEVFCPHAPTANVATLWVDGGKLSGGGVVGGLVGWVLLSLTKQVGTVIIAGAVLILCALLLFDVTPHNVWVYTRYKAHKHREAVKAAREARPPRQRYTFRVDEPEEYEEPEENKKKDIIAENERIVADMEEKMRDVPVPEEVSVTPEVERVGEGESGELDLDRIFSEEDDLPAPEEIEVPEITRVPIEPPKPVEPPKPAIRHRYEFPPVSLLKKPAGKSTAEGDEEARQNAVKLVRTLASFKVNTRISNISRGPTVTRYERVPEEGVRVRSVSNLVDDIALSLATGGVRIEAPIPGKSAIGIEVPNKVVETVYLRELIDNDEFKYAKGLTAALGMDVAGAPRYFDITKMPHLLIAGTTGSGKSVCINSILISLLYRADPEDLKLILIDPKKAAGTLNWACIEMERRFELIEDVGVRDIKGYNEAIKGDPDREYLPHIVIIIDELADFMMTAPDEVENSICRLAQKARAAGMHLIIGTQRPSVDVITGLIKANVPSRIAFTVGSQVDSRVILDTVGAEKLIGRGDMLFAPIGCTKPSRVQGAFVSDSEVDAVVDFIKGQMDEEMVYDQNVVESIEKEAERCGTKGKGAASAESDGGGDDDPRLMEALEVAVESGKVSTSLLQRRMSIGYGKAAKLIDQLEAHGWVGPPDGPRPRELRITKAQFMEMALSASSGDDAQ